MGDQMEIDPDLYESSPQPTSHPLFAHREPSASLSSTKSFSYDGAWFTPVAHTVTMRKGSKSSWVWAYGRNFATLKVESIGDATFAKLQRRLRSTAAHRTPIELVFICKLHHII